MARNRITRNLLLGLFGGSGADPAASFTATTTGGGDWHGRCARRMAG